LRDLWPGAVRPQGVAGARAPADRQ